MVCEFEGGELVDEGFVAGEIAAVGAGEEVAYEF